MIKASLRLDFMIQFKARTPNNILLIPYITFTHFVTSHNVLLTSVNFNNKMSNNFYYKFTLMIKILML